MSMNQNSQQSRTSFLQAVELELIDESDGNETQEYIQEDTRLRNWKSGSVDRQYQAVKGILLEIKKLGYTMPTLDKKGVLSLIQTIQEKSDWSEYTKESNWNKFVRFYRWGYRKHGASWNVEARNIILGDGVGGANNRWLYKKDKNKIIRKDTFTTEEMVELVNAEHDLCYKAFFGVTFECGLRIGESLSLLIRDVEKTPAGFDVHVRESKTEKRTVWVEKYFASYLDKWLQVHPDKNNKNAKLFLNTLGRPLEDAAANKKLKEVSARLFPEKTKVSVHSLRHSWATETASYLTEAQMCNFFGWTMGSKMCATYIRKQKVDVRRAMRQAHGLEEQATIKEAGKRCGSCQHINPEGYDYCDECKLPLDPERMARAKQAQDMQVVFDRMMSEKFAALVEQLRKENKALS